MKALVFDTETTGLINNLTVDLDKQPYVIEFYGGLFDLTTMKCEKEIDILIKPPILLPTKVKGDKGIADITGITDEMLAKKKPFKDHASDIAALIEEAPVVIAHNLNFDHEMVDIEMRRLEKPLNWPKRQICTIEQTIHLRGHRLNQSKLYGILFPGETYDAHRAKNDVEALVRICNELLKRGVL